MEAVAEFIERVGPGVALAVLILLPTLAIVRVTANSRAKLTEALAAKEMAEAATETASAASITNVNQMAMHFMQVQSEAQKTMIETIKAMQESHQQYNKTLELQTEMIDRIGKNYYERGLVIIEQMGLSNEVLQGVISSSAAAQASAMVAAENAAAAQVAMGGVVATGADILGGIGEITRKLGLLTTAIEEKGEVDDGLRAEILTQMAHLNAYLTRKEVTEAKQAKEKQDEQPEPQTTVALTGSVTVLPNLESLSGGAG